MSRLPAGPSVLVGSGDDAALVAAPDGRVLATVDVLVEGRHFRRDWSSPYDVGRRAAAQSLADVAAMGGRATALLIGFAAPADLPLAWADGLADGLRDETDLVGASVVGGDLVAAAEVTISVTALGDLGGREPLTRAGAIAGDIVVVAGRLGYAAAGLALLHAGHRDHPLADAHRRPDVAYAAATSLAEVGAHAMIDVSDGLAADLGHVAAASGMRVEISGGALPVAAELLDAAQQLGADARSWVAGGGDDHAFAATLPAESLELARAALAGTPFAVIGRVTEGAGVVFTDGTPPEVAGHDHFSGAPRRSAP